MHHGSDSLAAWAAMTTPLLGLERRFGIRRLRRGMLVMLTAWLGYFAVISLCERALDKVTVPFLDVRLGIFLIAQGTAAIFLAALVLLARFSSATR